MATRRRQWSQLSAAQQRRYLAAGASGRLASGRSLDRRQVRDYYNRGASLKSARGHVTRERPVRVPAPREPLARLIAGEADTKNLRELERWQRNQAPGYLRNPERFGPDTAAALTRIPLNPNHWARVQMFTRKNGTVDVYITSTRGREYKTTLPDKTSAYELADWVRMKSLRRLSSEAEPAVDDVEWETP